MWKISGKRKSVLIARSDSLGRARKFCNSEGCALTIKNGYRHFRDAPVIMSRTRSEV